MNPQPLEIVVLGLSVSSSWGNGHATTYRGLLRELARAGHKITFLERDVPWYAGNRDLPKSPYFDIQLYSAVEELWESHLERVQRADAVIVGSYVPDGTAIGTWVVKNARGIRVFYDIDTPVTLSQLEVGQCEYLTADLIPQFDLYLSFTGGPVPRRIEEQYGSPAARTLYCSVDTEQYYPEAREFVWDLGYLGTYSADRQPKLDELLLQTARSAAKRRFVVAGPMYPECVDWPLNVDHTPHLAPDAHRGFYNAQRFTLNITRDQMVAIGYSPSVRLFEAAACGTPIISDPWVGLTTLFRLGTEMLVAGSGREVRAALEDLPEPERLAMAERARCRVLTEHTAAQRAQQLAAYLQASFNRKAQARQRRCIPVTPLSCLTAE